MKKLLSICAVLTLGSGLLMAQSDQPATPADTARDAPGVTRVVTPRHENNWGWLGLVGLAGLAGLRRRSAVVQDHKFQEHKSGDVRRVA